MPAIYELLTSDHARLRELLAEIRAYADVTGENALRALSIASKELEVHMAFEEEVFYPMVRDATGLDDEIDRGFEEHDEVASLLDELDRLQPGSDGWTDAVEDLAGVLDDHFANEEAELFPACRASLDKSVADILGDEYAHMRNKAFAGC